MTLKHLNTQALLRQHNIRPKKSLGQNFLIQPGALEKVVAAAEVAAEDEVLEIGAGVGSLTYALAQIARQVTAVEIDRTLFPALQEALKDFRNVSLVEGDFLTLDPDQLMSKPDYLVVANIPYYISSAILRHLLSARNKPRRMVLTVQKEVAERVVARDGKHSLLSLSVHLFGKPSLPATLPAGNFYPVPDVDSAVLVIDLFPESVIGEAQQDAFFKLAKAGFGQKRKTLRNTLSAGLGVSGQEAESLLAAAAIHPQRRAESLSLQEWALLTQVYSETNRGN